MTTDLFRNLNLRNNLLPQKAKVKWLKDVDMNTKLFHRVINGHRKRDEIIGMKIDGVWCEDVKLVKEGIQSYFQKHYSKVTGHKSSLSESLFPIRLSTEDNSFLTAPFSQIKVKLNIENCDNSKRPGPNGFNYSFIKQYWHVIKVDFMKMLQEFHSNGKLVRGFNPSFIVLIPKKDDAESLSDYRPISLIGCSYKILAKILASRLSKVLDGLISENQSALI